MPTLVDLEGFEHQVTTSNATTTMNPKLWDTVNTPANMSFVTGRDGIGKALRITLDNVNQVRLQRNVTTAGTLFVLSGWVRMITAPTTNTARCFMTNSDGFGFIGINNTGNIVASWGSGTGVVTGTGPSLSDGLWHLVDARFNTSPATHTIDWTVDGVSQTQSTSGLTAASNITSWAAGTNGTNSDAVYELDDFVVSATTGDYPMGRHTVFSVVPAADGTHNAGTNIMERASDGTDIGVVTAWDLLDEWPPTTGINNADSVTSSASGATNYAEVLFGDKPDYAQQTLWGVSGIVAHQSDATGANTGITRIVDSAGTTLTDIFSGDMSEITDHYTWKLIAAPSGGWSVGNFSGIRGRVGFGTLQPGAPEWLALMVSAATPDDVAVPILVTQRRA